MRMTGHWRKLVWKKSVSLFLFLTSSCNCSLALQKHGWEEERGRWAAAACGVGTLGATEGSQALFPNWVQVLGLYQSHDLVRS